ncbi:class I SAM-dependent methyltransferase [Methylorubrum populi]|uniref:class I SAM-dependent methyltransferase n=1 Tax=Methylorubrum populi TaxID=223967 RepID=UPI00114E156F|nr:class I SAM-dependent methyltransferase [Methylorubrum populi]QDI82177.1 class I SAM-dependent methyltransferase [Methylorubrum populi]
MSDDYGVQFFDDQVDGSLKSARIIAPWLVNLVGPKTVIDVGCGLGTWACAFKESGVERVTGIDGDYVDRSRLLISEADFIPVDLSSPPDASRFGRFELAVSLEVAEHLPAEVAEKFIDLLTGLSDTVFFSSAIPGQGGTHHINEQWQSYWVQLFSSRGFRPLDIIRSRFWDAEVEWWYAQNTFLFARPGVVPQLQVKEDCPIDMVHPHLYSKRMSQLKLAQDEVILLKSKLKAKS